MNPLVSRHAYDDYIFFVLKRALYVLSIYWVLGVGQIRICGFLDNVTNLSGNLFVGNSNIHESPFHSIKRYGR
jgi:hypothetical protein